MHLLHKSAALAAVVVALSLAACEDDPPSRDRANNAPAIGAGGSLAVKPSLLGEDGETASAGVAESYVPTGDIIADSGFRPQVDGFAFENYGNDVGPQNLTPAEVQALFGDQVCVGGNGDDCRLIPPAERWLANENERMAGGHCMGFSVAAIRMFQESLEPEPFGAEEPAELEIVGNADLQRSIAEHWVYQDLPLIQEEIVQGAPAEVLDTLVEALDSGEEDYTLGILMADGSGGHAVTPFAVEDKGDGTAAILVYDNNFPGITRAVTVDIEDDTWTYVGGTNPQNLGEVYEGTAETESMVLLPTNPGDEIQPCFFCREDALTQGAGLGTVLPDAKAYSEVTLGGDPANHPHLVFVDEEGRRTGIVDGELITEIPGIRVQRGFSVRNWESAPEPKYQIPAGRDIAVTIDGSNLKKRTTAKIDLVGNGLVVAIEDIEMSPGQEDNVLVSGGGDGLVYEVGGKGESAPQFFAGLEDGDASYTFAATAAGVRKGSVIGMFIDREEGNVLLDASDVKGSVDGKAFFGLLLGKATAEEELVWGTDELELGGRGGDVYFNYKETPEAGEPLTLEVGPEDGPFETLKAPFDP